MDVFSLAYVFGLLLGVCFGNQNETEVDCSLPAESGLCYAHFPMFYYDAPSGKCLTFIYGGCGGNSNRFWTEQSCLESCGGQKASAAARGAIVSDNCNLDKETGNCSSSMLRYYFNKESGSCEEFRYTGCGANANNFNYLFECERTCPGDLNLGNICELPSQSGKCRAFFLRFFFNKETGECEEFIFGGCGGNHNNFQLKEDCEGYCKSGAKN